MSNRMIVRKTTMTYLFSPKQMLSPSLFLFQLLFSPFLQHCSARDSITDNSCLSDSRGETLVSLEGNFELGFFTPNGSSNKRYLGIWYYSSNPPVVVWIANRDDPLSSTTGTLVFGKDGNLKVLDGGGRPNWSTNLEPSSTMNRKARLMDTGNMVISEKDENDGSERIVWQSFDNPTDTFLPGMKMEQGIALTSWRSYNEPASGNFTFELDQEANQFVIWKRSMKYWMSENSSRDGVSGGMPSVISYLLSNFTSSLSYNFSVPFITSSLYANTRMVMRFSGQIQFLKWDSQKFWSLIWEEPRTRCSVYNACGNFGSCNSYNEVACNCLPGFQPTSPEYWISGDYSGGCTRSSPLCSDRTKMDTFLNLKRMKVANPDSQFKVKDEEECKMECLNNCQCQAFSFEESQTCWIWLEDLRDLQEEYDGGRDLSVRVKVPDIAESISRSCGTCSTKIVPYPLSTRPGCGDPKYFNFHCNTSTGQLSFEAQGNIYKVTKITPETRKISLLMADSESCKVFDTNGKLWPLNQSSPYQVIRWCNAGGGNFPGDFSSAGGNVVEITWDPPSEPTCSSSAECRDWPNSTCTRTGDRKRHCICNKKFQWDGLNINCTGEGHRTDLSSAANVSLPLVIVIAFSSVVVLLVLTSCIICMYLHRKKLGKAQGTRGIIYQRKRSNHYQSQKLVKEIIDSGRFNEDETKTIDVPHFDLESILRATKNFSNANKLGQGGFGPVYKVVVKNSNQAKFAGGDELAVKRLSSCSSQGMEEFKNEVVLIAKLQHRNLVRLLGYCVEDDEKILLYEYMPNISLDSFIFDRKLCIRLDWDMRYSIIVGITRGLLYLHQDSRLRIIHRDLKSSNILLDEEMNPKISDFGLARIFGGKETAANTNRVVGTYGYIAPEYALDGLFSFKSDVFSFGVVVLEIISGKRNTGSYQAEQSLSLLGYAWNLWRENKAMELLDKTLCRSYNKDEFIKCLNLGLLCVQEDPADRPTMSNVLSMLGSDTTVLPSPKQPAFVVRRSPSSKASTSSKPETCSQNGLTITLEDGR